MKNLFSLFTGARAPRQNLRGLINGTLMKQPSGPALAPSQSSTSAASKSLSPEACKYAKRHSSYLEWVLCERLLWWYWSELNLMLSQIVRVPILIATLPLQNSRRRPVRAVLHISGDGLRVVEEETKGLIVDQTIEKVSFCAPDRNHERGFR